MKLFSIEHKNNHDIIKIFGIKMKFKNKEKEFQEALDELKLENKFLKRSLFDTNKTLIKSLKNPIYHINAFSLGNAGDNILVSALRKSINNHLDFKPEYVDRYARCYVNSNDIYLMNEAKAVIVGGGGLFLKDTFKNDVSGWQFPIPANLIDDIKVPFIFLGVGYNRFRGQEEFDRCFFENINKIVEKASFMGIRNHGSIEALKNYLDDSLKEKLTYHPCATTILSRLYEIKKEETEPFVAIECAFDRGRLRYGDNSDKILNKIAKTAYELSKNYKIKYYSHMTSDNKVLPYFDKFNFDYEVVPLNGAKSKEDFLKLYSAPKLVIGMRGHAQMIPFGCNTPILSIISHDKMQWFLDDINHPEWGADVLDEDFEEKLLSRANNILNNEALIKEQLIEAQDKLFEITESNLKKVSSIIYGN